MKLSKPISKRNYFAWRKKFAYFPVDVLTEWNEGGVDKYTRVWWDYYDEKKKGPMLVQQRYPSEL